MNKTRKKAVALISGGLDSLLATKAIIDQGIHVEGLNFYSGFFGVGTTCVTRKEKEKKTSSFSAEWIAKQLHIPLHVIDIVEKFKDVLLHPQYGHGAYLNPCLDCKIFMITQAKKWMEENNFDFIITGEVVGQRPMSQRKQTLPLIAKKSTANELLLRPLCAKNLPPTLPEKENWVNRDALFNFSGRSRKPHMALAKQFGFDLYPQPAGGCLLTDPGYTRRLEDLWNAKGEKKYSRDDIDLLKIGRHLRPRKEFKMIVGREENENKFLEKWIHRLPSLYAVDYTGPFVLIDGEITKNNLYLAAKITARFGKGKNENKVKISICIPNEDPFILEVQPIRQDEKLDSCFI